MYCVLLCKRKCYALENSGRQMKQLVNCESKETRRHLKEEAENKRRLHNTTSTTSVLTISLTREHEHNKHQVKEYSVENFGLKFEMINVEICPGFYKGDSGYFKIHFLSSKNWFHSFRDVPTHQSDFWWCWPTEFKKFSLNISNILFHLLFLCPLHSIYQVKQLYQSEKNSPENKRHKYRETGNYVFLILTSLVCHEWGDRNREANNVKQMFLDPSNSFSGFIWHPRHMLASLINPQNNTKLYLGLFQLFLYSTEHHLLQ